MSDRHISPEEYRRGFKTIERQISKDKPAMFYTQHESWKVYEVWMTATSLEGANRNIQACVDSLILRQQKA